MANRTNDAKVPLIGIDRHRIATDGHGVTTLVGFFGCPLHCKFCLNDQCHDTRRRWRRLSPQALYDELKQDELYFLATGGGVTFGGGEPCLQSRFIKAFRNICGTAWNITVETSLYVPQNHLRRLLNVVNTYIVDIKDLNPDIYLEYTSKDIGLLKENLQWLTAHVAKENIFVRVPSIPNHNTPENIEYSIEELKRLGLVNIERFDYINPKQVK
jgi:putative pyruvate formate-lyase 1-activating enzyme